MELSPIQKAVLHEWRIYCVIINYDIVKSYSLKVRFNIIFTFARTSLISPVYVVCPVEQTFFFNLPYSEKFQILEILIMKFLYSPGTSFILGPNVTPRHFNLCSSLVIYHCNRVCLNIISKQVRQVLNMQVSIQANMLCLSDTYIEPDNQFDPLLHRYCYLRLWISLDYNDHWYFIESEQRQARHKPKFKLFCNVKAHMLMFCKTDFFG